MWETPEERATRQLGTWNCSMGVISDGLNCGAQGRKEEGGELMNVRHRLRGLRSGCTEVIRGQNKIT